MRISVVYLGSPKKRQLVSNAIAPVWQRKNAGRKTLEFTKIVKQKTAIDEVSTTQERQKGCVSHSALHLAGETTNSRCNGYPLVLKVRW